MPSASESGPPRASSRRRRSINAPTAVDDEASTRTGVAVVINVAANDSDVDGNLNPASVAVISGTGPANGSAVAGGDSTITYTSNGGFTGADQFNYQICDTQSVCATATVHVTVTSGTQFRGTVFDDQNGDGIRQSDEPGLAAWTVRNAAG